MAVMVRLRAECPWKAAQTHRSLTRYLLEETHETVEAIETGGPDDLREELGDLLLQVFFHAVIAAEAGEFTLEDVVGEITEKMIRRNPHVFAVPERARPLSVDEVNDAWEAIKATEKPRESVTAGLGSGLPALLYADKVLDRLSRAAGPQAAASIAPSPVLPADELGRRLLALVEVARASGVDPEQALRDAVRHRVKAHEGRSEPN